MKKLCLLFLCITSYTISSDNPLIGTLRILHMQNSGLIENNTEQTIFVHTELDEAIGSNYYPQQKLDHTDRLWCNSGTFAYININNTIHKIVVHPMTITSLRIINSMFCFQTTSLFTDNTGYYLKRHTTV